jgi:hypothetical protein
MAATKESLTLEESLCRMVQTELNAARQEIAEQTLKLSATQAQLEKGTQDEEVSILQVCCIS